MKSKWPIGRKLLSVSLAVTAVTLLLGAVGFYGAIKSSETITEIGTVSLQSLSSILVIKECSATVNNGFLSMLDPKMDAAGRKEQLGLIGKTRARYEEAWKAYEALPKNAEEATAWQQLGPAWEAWRAENNKFLTICQELDKVAAGSAEATAALTRARDQLMGPCETNRDKANAILDQIAKNTQSLVATEAKDAIGTAGFLKLLCLITAIGGVVVSMGMGIMIARSTHRTLTQMAAAMADGAEQVAAAAGHVSSASQSLAEGTSEQAAAIEETSSSIEEMSSMTKQNAGNAGEAKNLAANARDGAAKGVEAMTKMSRAIDDIKKSADQTAKIIKTIDEIAFQTNLLALNAAVEAARAGDAGKGFAVVAEEVRNLAHRSAEAAKNTANMIEESVKNAENGVAISQEVGKSLTEIADVARKVNDLVAEIAAASNEQSQGIEQINTAVSQMDKVTQSNAANAEESASASEELSAQAEQLNQMVDELRVLVGGAANNGAGAAARKPAAHKATAHREVTPKTPAAAKKKELAHLAASSGNGKHHASPEDVIPLADEKELARF